MTKNEKILTYSELLEERGEDLIKQYGLDPAKVKYFVEKAKSDWNKYSDGENEYVEKYVFDLFENALAVFPQEKVFRIFEKRNLALLSVYDGIIEDLANPSTPFFNLQDLENIIEQFIFHLEKNKESILLCGHPETTFEPSAWFYYHLSKLYYIKSPVGVNNRRNESGDFDRFYIWASNRGQCSYSEAPIVEGLTSSDAFLLDSSRSNFFKLKIEILKTLLNALKARTTVSLWDNCLHLLTEYLTDDQVEFYLKIDKLYIGYDFKKNKFKGAGGLIAGGLTDLFEVIGHIEQEMTNGKFANIRDDLGRLVKQENNGRIRLFEKSYFSIRKKLGQSVVDQALKRFVDLEIKEETFWKNYRDRVNQALAQEFRTKITIEFSAKKKYAPKAISEIIAMGNAVIRHQENTGLIPSIFQNSEDLLNKEESNAFLKEGQYWTFSYKGKTVRLKDSKGLKYISYLLDNPEREVPVFELVSFVEKKFGFAEFTNSENILGQKEILDLTKARQELKEDLEEAERNSDIEKSAKIKEEISQIEEYVSASTGIGGKSRKFNGNEKIRISVTKRIGASLAVIKKEHPELSLHLNNSIRRGWSCSYFPNERIHWGLSS